MRLALGTLGRFSDVADSAYMPYAERCKKAAAGTAAVVTVERARDGHFRISYADGARFVIDATASEVYGISRSNLTHDDLLIYLQGPVLGFLLRLRGVTCLHASAVEVDGGAIAVVGSAGMGKSTSAAMFARLGLTVLTDDVLALSQHDDFIYAHPGVPRVLLWPESVTALFGHADALPRLVSTWEKRYLDLTQDGYRFAKTASPLRAIYVLAERLPAESKTEISDMVGASAMMHMVANSYANDFLDADLRSQELQFFGQVLAGVRVRQVRAPNDRAALPLICEAIVNDARSLRVS